MQHVARKHPLVPLVGGYFLAEAYYLGFAFMQSAQLHGPHHAKQALDLHKHYRAVIP